MNKNKKRNEKANEKKLDKEQIEHIKEGLKQMKKKQFVSDAEVKKAFDKWMK